MNQVSKNTGKNIGEKVRAIRIKKTYPRTVFQNLPIFHLILL